MGKTEATNSSVPVNVGVGTSLQSERSSAMEIASAAPRACDVGDEGTVNGGDLDR